METRASGAAGYTAMALDRLGLTSVTVGAVGDDMWGDFIRRELARYPRIDLASLETAFGVPTGLSVALLDQQRPARLRHLLRRARTLLTLPCWLATSRACSRRAIVLVCGYFFMPALRGEPMRGFLRRARQAGCVTMLDTGWDLDDWPAATRHEVLSLLPDVDIFAPNEDETHALVGEGTPEQCATRLLDSGAHAVAMKLGPHGSLWASRNGLIWQSRSARHSRRHHRRRRLLQRGADLRHGKGLGHRHVRLAFANAFCSIIVSRLRDRLPTID